MYVAAESADEVYKVRFDCNAAEVVKVIEVGYMPTEVEGPHGLTVSPDGKHWFVTMAHGKPYGVLYKYTTATDELVVATIDGRVLTIDIDEGAILAEVPTSTPSTATGSAHSISRH